MRAINGKRVVEMDGTAVAAWAAGRRGVTIDLGAGDGRFARELARRRPEEGAIAVDLAAANMRDASRRAGGNALFVVADALALPDALAGVATRVTIQFPWGSLLRGLLGGDAGLMAGIAAVARAGAKVEIALNAGALAEAGWGLEAGGERVAAVLRDAGLAVGATRCLGAAELRRWPTTWAKRLAWGPRPWAVRIEAALAPARATGAADAWGRAPGAAGEPLIPAARGRARAGRAEGREPTAGLAPAAGYAGPAYWSASQARLSSSARAEER